MRLAEAFERFGSGTLTFVGDGPLRGSSKAAPVSRSCPRAARRRSRRIAAAHVVCQPSLIEPFGQALLEAMACGRSVVATRVGGPPEFVPPDAGVLVDPLDVEAIADAFGIACGAALPESRPRATAAERHDVREQARRVEEVLERAA